MVWRTTADRIGEVPDIAGVYVVAAGGHILYVGQSVAGCVTRMRQHLNLAMFHRRRHAEDGKRARFVEYVGEFLAQVGQDSWPCIRIDFLEAPDHDWMREAEAELIYRFRPVFNLHLN